MIYVDEPKYKKSSAGVKTYRRKSYSHMVADSKEELKEFANKIGVKLHFWHAKGSLSHFDITSDQYLLAVENGATTVSSKDIVRYARKMNEDQST